MSTEQLNGVTSTTLADIDIRSGKVVTSVDLSGKQDKLTAGENITIEGNVISATGGGGGGGDVDLSGYATTAYVDEAIAGIDVTGQLAPLEEKANANTAAIEGVKNSLEAVEGEVDEISSSLDEKQPVGNYATKEELQTVNQAVEAGTDYNLSPDNIIDGLSYDNYITISPTVATGSACDSATVVMEVERTSSWSQLSTGTDITLADFSIGSLGTTSFKAKEFSSGQGVYAYQSASQSSRSSFGVGKHLFIIRFQKTSATATSQVSSIDNAANLTYNRTGMNGLGIKVGGSSSSYNGLTFKTLIYNRTLTNEEVALFFENGIDAYDVSLEEKTRLTLQKTRETEASLQEQINNIATPSLNGYATEAWVNDSLSGYATQEFVNNSLQGNATQAWVNNKNYLTKALYNEQGVSSSTDVVSHNNGTPAAYYDDIINVKKNTSSSVGDNSGSATRSVVVLADSSTSPKARIDNQITNTGISSVGAYSYPSNGGGGSMISAKTLTATNGTIAEVTASATETNAQLKLTDATGELVLTTSTISGIENRIGAAEGKITALEAEATGASIIFEVTNYTEGGTNEDSVLHIYQKVEGGDNQQVYVSNNKPLAGQSFDLTTDEGKVAALQALIVAFGGTVSVA